MKTPAKEEEQVLEEVTDKELEATLKEETPTEEKPSAIEETAKAEVVPTETTEAKPKKKKEEEEEEIVEERTYTIPLGKALIMPPRRRAPRAMHMIRAFIIKHMKIPSRAEEEDEDVPQLTITKEVNEHIWAKGIEKPPRKVRVRATKDKDGNVTVHLVEKTD
jgi:large subunit ribosomal protein L31e